MTVVSGYRTEAYNAERARRSNGVAADSRHPKGEAADLRPINKLSVGMLHMLVLDKYRVGELPALGGLGFYPRSGWIHVDTFKAADGHLRRWTGR